MISKNCSSIREPLKQNQPWKPMKPSIQLKQPHPAIAESGFRILFALCCFALLPGAKAVSPTPDGCYPNFTTAKGCDALSFLGAGAGNTGVGWRSLFSVGDANFNTGVGAGTLVFNTGDSNTAVGAVALLLNGTGTQNVALGTDALVFNDTGSDNTAVGAFALFNNVNGEDNTAVGGNSLFSNTEGLNNTATGYSALFNNTTGSNNTATGINALLSNTEGEFNTANGVSALASNTGGVGNTATGVSALQSNTTGSENTANGDDALFSNTTGGDNTAIGGSALSFNTTGEFNTAIGSEALRNNVSGDSNTAIGEFAGFNITGSGNVCIGAGVVGFAGESNITRIRNVYESPATDRAVYVTADGRIGTLSSSRRYKEEIKPINEASEMLFALKPVTFRYKKAIDPKQALSFGLIAEEVAEANPDLITRDEAGRPQTVRYEAVNAMLLNEFLKEHRTVQELKEEIAALRATVSEQAAQIEKVSAQVEMNKPVISVAANEP
jgi:trimeric autotransporter adhesin